MLRLVQGAVKTGAKRKREEVTLAVPQVDGATDDLAAEGAAAATGPHAAAGGGGAAKAADVADDEVEAGTSRSEEVGFLILNPGSQPQTSSS